MLGMNEGGNTPIIDGQIAKCIILGVDFPATSILAIAKINGDEQERCEVLGLDFEPITPSHKQHGLSVKYAILEVGEDKIVTGNSGSLKTPSYIFTGTINQLTLPQMVDKNKKLSADGKAFGYNFQRMGGGNSVEKESGNVRIVALHANPNVEKDWDSGIVANEPDIDAEKYSELIAKEQARQQAWDSYTAEWNKLTEEQAKKELLEGISRRLLLCTTTDKGKIIYAEAELGMCFEAQITKPEGSKYFDLKTFEYIKADKKYQIHNNLGHELDDESVQIAKEINFLTEQSKLNYLRKQAEKLTGNIYDDDDGSDN